MAAGASKLVLLIFVVGLAVVEAGARVRVPPFIENGQVVRIHPENGEYLSKA